MKSVPTFRPIFLLVLSLCLGTATASSYARLSPSNEENEYMVDSILYILLPTGYGSSLEAVVEWGYPHNGHIEIPDTVGIEGTSYPVTGIFLSAFKGGDVITSVTLPYTIKTIDPYAFQGTGMDSIAIPLGAHVRDACFDGSSIKTVKFVDNPYQSPKSCYIGSNCFNIQELDRVEIDSCETVSLRDTGGSIKQLWLKGVETLDLGDNDFNMFYYYGHLRSVRIDSPIPPKVTGWEATEERSRGLRKILLFVPDESVQAYSGSYFWKEFYDVYPVSRIAELEELVAQAAGKMTIGENPEDGIEISSGPCILRLGNLRGEPYGIYDTAGNIVHSVKGMESLELSLPRGVYIVKGKRCKEKIVL